jgi:F-type H+-transporting ATPase subunit epsilon
MADAKPQSGKLQVRLVTPDRVVLNTPADSVDVPASTGYLEVLPGHAPLLAELGAGVVTLHGGEANDAKYFVAWGFVEVLPDRVTLLAESAQKPEDINPSEAQSELDRGRKMWQDAGDTADAYSDANEVIREAETKLQVGVK